MRRKHISWSQYSLFKRSPETYKKIYIDEEEGDVTDAMEFGKDFAEGLEKDGQTGDMDIDMAKLIMPTYQKKEYEMNVVIDGIKLRAVSDMFSRKGLKLGEVKTGKKWTQKMADNSEQLKFYDLVILRKYGKMANEIILYWWETGRTEKGEVILTGKHQAFKVKHKLADLIRFFSDVKKVKLEIDKMWELELKNKKTK